MGLCGAMIEGGCRLPWLTPASPGLDRGWGPMWPWLLLMVLAPLALAGISSPAPQSRQSLSAVNPWKVLCFSQPLADPALHFWIISVQTWSDFMPLLD